MSEERERQFGQVVRAVGGEDIGKATHITWMESCDFRDGVEEYNDPW